MNHNGEVMWSNLLDIFTRVTEVVQILYAHQNYRQAEQLHTRGVAADVSQHFQTLSQDLFVAAKEADRDVWEQHNERFSNLNLLAVLMLSITASLVTEGTFSIDHESSDFVQFAFVFSTSAASASLLICLAASFRATRNMSHFMLARSASLSSRIDALVSEQQLSGAMQRAYLSLPGVTLPTREDLAREIYEADMLGPAAFASLPSGTPRTSSANAAARRRASERPALRATRSESFHFAAAAAASRIRFADFFDSSCGWLESVATGSFASGSVFATVAVALLMHNEFQRTTSPNRSWFVDMSLVFSGVIALGLALSACILLRGHPPSSRDVSATAQPLPT